MSFILNPFTGKLDANGSGGGGGMAIGDPVTGGTPTRVLFVDDSGNLGDDSALTYDATNNAAQIGGTAITTTTKLRLNITSATDTGLEIRANPFPGSQSGNLATFYNGLGVSLSAITSAGVFANPDGTVSVPGISFNGEQTTGFYRKAVNEIGVSIAGVLVSHWTTSALTIAGTVSASNLSGTNTGDQSLAAYVVGPASAGDSKVVLFDGTTGKLIKDSGLTLSGTNTGDQTITLTGGVTGSGTGSFAATVVTNANLTGPVTSVGNATTITDKAVTLAKMDDVATSTVFYRKTAATGVPEVQTLATLKTDLGLTGTNSGDQTITLTGGVTGSGTGSFAATVVTNANLTGHVTSVGNAAVLGSFTVAQLNTAISDATLSPSALMITARLSLSASASLPMVRFISVGNSICFRSTDCTFIPHSSLALSTIS